MREKEITPHKDVIPHELVEMLKAIGLNLYERKLYSVLLVKGSATAGELADLSGVPRARVYDVLQNLADKGFVMIQQSKPLKYIALPPKEALDRAAKNIAEKMNKTINMIKTLKESEIINQLEKHYQQRMSELEEGELVGTLKGKFTIDAHEESIFKKARNSIDLIVSDTGLNELYRKYYYVLKEAYERGIKIRIIAPLTEENRRAYEVLSDIAEIRDAKKIEDVMPYTKLAIKDNEEALLHLTHDKENSPVSYSSIWTRSGHFVKNFASKTFDLLWKMLEE